MAQIAWAAFTVFIFCMISLGAGPQNPAAQWAILALAAVMAVICLAAFWCMSGRPSKPRPVSPYMGREHEKADPIAWALGPDYSTFDRLDGLDTRTSKDTK